MLRRVKEGGRFAQTGNWSLIQHPCRRRFFPPFLSGGGSQEAPANRKTRFQNRVVILLVGLESLMFLEQD